jgi:hypothetical protein
MSTADDGSMLDSNTRVLQIIAGSLIAGPVIFLAIVVAIGPIGALARPAAAAAGPGAGANAAPQPAVGSIELTDILTWTAIASAAIGLPLSFLVPSQIAGGIRRGIAAEKWTPPVAPSGQRGPFSRDAMQSDTGKLAFAYQTQFIIGAAITEGLAFFAIVTYMLGRNPIALGLALLLIGALIVRFPTRLRLASWIERQQELLVQDRQAAS